MARLPRILEEKTRAAVVELVADRRHYEEVVHAITRARVSVWIATANLKDVHLEAPIGTAARARGGFVSITEHFESLVRSDVEVRILHGAAPSRPFRASLSRRRDLRLPGFEMRQCPRVHLKMIAVDGAYLYVGSANFTGAGLGAKSDGRRNFELGFSTDDDVLLDAAQSRFDRIWSGAECGACRLRTECPTPIDSLVRERAVRRPSGAAPHEQSSSTVVPPARRSTSRRRRS